MLSRWMLAGDNRLSRRSDASVFVCSNNVCLSCPRLTHTALCVMAGTVPSDFLCVCIYKNVDVMKLARITVLERHALTFAHAQTNNHSRVHTHTDAHTHIHTHIRQAGGGRMQRLGVPVCVCMYEREREKCMVFPSVHNLYLGLIM